MMAKVKSLSASKPLLYVTRARLAPSSDITKDWRSELTDFADNCGSSIQFDAWHHLQDQISIRIAMWQLRLSVPWKACACRQASFIALLLCSILPEATGTTFSYSETSFFNISYLRLQMAVMRCAHILNQANNPTTLNNIALALSLSTYPDDVLFIHTNQYLTTQSGSHQPACLLSAAAQWMKRRGPALPNNKISRLFRTRHIRFHDPETNLVHRAKRDRVLQPGSKLLVPKFAFSRDVERLSDKTLKGGSSSLGERPNRWGKLGWHAGQDACCAEFNCHAHYGMQNDLQPNFRQICCTCLPCIYD